MARYAGERGALARSGSGESCSAARAETAPLAQAAGRVLAEAIYADRDLPPWPRSTRDGYACRAEEANSHRWLALAGQIRAGEALAGSLGAGQVWEIMTGAPVPAGADAVFMVEHAGRIGSLTGSLDGSLIRLEPPRVIGRGENIVPQAAEAGRGERLLSPGARLGAAQIALAAQCGYAQLEVARRPRVAILSTGDEIVPVDSTPGPSQIRNSNAPMLAALAAAAGGEPAILPPVPDREEDLDTALAAALDLAPAAGLLLITGGISAGRFDLAAAALTRAGARFLFRGVAMQPGKPLAFGELPRRGAASPAALPFFALPGNPISSAVTFQLFAAPVLAALAGEANPGPRFALAELDAGWRGKPGLARFLPAWCDFAADLAANAAQNPKVRLVPWQGSGDLAAFARSNCCVAIPADAERIEAGSLVRILLF